MFIEFHLLDNNEKIMLNINHINSIYQTNGKAIINVNKICYEVAESYEEIVAAINNHISDG